MTEIIKIDENTFEEVNRNRIDIRILKGLVDELNIAIDEVKLWPSMTHNVEKDMTLERLKNEKQTLQARIDELKAIV